MTSGREPRTVQAAGALLWRRRRGELQVLLVHRGKYDDWSWPKGKLDPGEDWVTAAVREVQEETGLRPRLGIPLPRSVNSLRSGDLKEVRYWAAEVTGGDGQLEHEIDEVAWLSPARARARLSYHRDVLQLQALEAAHEQAHLRSWPLIVVRHAEAYSRGRWRGPDTERPLTLAGHRRARRLIPLLRAYDVRELVSSPSRRCAQTIEPYAEAAEVGIRWKNGLTEETFERHPDKAIRHTVRALGTGAPIALCTHRPLLPSMLAVLAEHAASPGRCDTLRQLADEGLDKGEALVCQVAGLGSDARVVAVERHRPAPVSRS
ncbi:NUDIX hydrolase [Calidifontibacter sp. DB0510]|uniref:NUDIX hydrolase n=1 Tax=Metallococcus carri TaxID=1656884 RepID=A0A967E9R4_9MICO|nr:NUDIX hydrolase [Metallococcus carri]NHN55500.1 NUDIX hydrolase [Metallococcus carri]NOP38316.1 NUDIX hydrolase [Calidifontibacter sp. DB2511S]